MREQDKARIKQKLKKALHDAIELADQYGDHDYDGAAIYSDLRAIVSRLG